MLHGMYQYHDHDTVKLILTPHTFLFRLLSIPPHLTNFLLGLVDIQLITFHLAAYSVAGSRIDRRGAPIFFKNLYSPQLANPATYMLQRGPGEILKS